MRTTMEGAAIDNEKACTRGKSAVSAHQAPTAAPRRTQPAARVGDPAGPAQAPLLAALPPRRAGGGTSQWYAW